MREALKQAGRAVYTVRPACFSGLLHWCGGQTRVLVIISGFRPKREEKDIDILRKKVENTPCFDESDKES